MTFIETSVVRLPNSESSDNAMAADRLFYTVDEGETMHAF